MSATIMIVDDSGTIRDQVAGILSAAGFDVLQAVDGADALAQIRSGSVLSLVVCDVNMPNMNGIELLEKLHSDGGYNHLPILMLTTEGQPELLARAKALGARGWMVKPFRSDHLLRAAQKLARVREPGTA